ncbi:MAG: DMT family transporter [Thermoguttaceae bacterium]
MTALFCLAGSILGFALIPIFLRYFANSLDAWTVNGVRYSVGALFWLPFLLVLDREPTATESTPSNSKPHGVWVDAIVPSLLNVVAQACFGLGPYYVSASTIGFILRLAFLFTIVFGFIVLAEERLLARRSSFWVGAGISLFGLGAMYYDKLGLGGASAIGTLIVLASAIGTGAYTVSVRYFMSHYSVRLSFGVISLYTSILLVALMFAVGDYSPLLHLSLKLWMLLTLSAMIGIAFGQVLMYQAIQHFGPVVATGAQLVTPFITYLVAAVCLGESMTSSEWIGGVLLIVGGGLLVLARLQIERRELAQPQSVCPSAPQPRTRTTHREFACQPGAGACCVPPTKN